MKKVVSNLTIAGFILLSTACSGGGTVSNKKVADPCRDDASEQIGKVEEYQKEENENYRVKEHSLSDCRESLRRPKLFIQKIKSFFNEVVFGDHVANFIDDQLLLLVRCTQ